MINKKLLLLFLTLLLVLMAVISLYFGFLYHPAESPLLPEEEKPITTLPPLQPFGEQTEASGSVYQERINPTTAYFSTAEMFVIINTATKTVVVEAPQAPNLETAKQRAVTLLQQEGYTNLNNYTFNVFANKKDYREDNLPTDDEVNQMYEQLIREKGL